MPMPILSVELSVVELSLGELTVVWKSSISEKVKTGSTTLSF